MTIISPKEKFNLGNRIMLDKNLSPATRLVGWYIADHVHTERGYAWPSQEFIADKLGLTTRTVQRAMNDLAGYFNINHRDGLANEYRPRPLTNCRGYPRQNVARPPTKCRVTPDKLSAHPIKYPLNDPLSPSTDVDGAPARSNRQEQKAATDDGFVKFYESYPRKVAKKAAAKAFARAIKETTLEQMLAALAIDKRDWKEERFTPHPATWLNQGRYLDHQDKLNPLKTYRPPGHEND